MKEFTTPIIAERNTVACLSIYTVIPTGSPAKNRLNVLQSLITAAVLRFMPFRIVPISVRKCTKLDKNVVVYPTYYHTIPHQFSKSPRV